MDKLPIEKCDKTVAAIASAIARHPAAHPTILATSAETGEGIAELRAVLAELADPTPFR